ncbi:lytic transglycosylase domain-containing protein [uncultured Treponema sp.]|uniref:lytic transglycosylase domain-containing protein n=1 Tax=uncultured Treponema sp. TaxID=162155 RepID=UPI0015BC1FAB|nr:lytic transglycosylase domain-containing protein [uncultured Treponema sp.]
MVKNCSRPFFFVFLTVFLLFGTALFAQTGGIAVPETEYAKKQIEKYIEAYTTPFGQKQLAEILDRGEAYRLYVRQEVKNKNLPPALEYLPVVESEYNPLAVSRSGARGLWQFMDNSIQGLLNKNDYIDERYDPWKSTDAALKKLEENYAQFGDWALAIAAYNCGAGTMKRILEKSEKKDFWYIAEKGLLRDQSVQYVPKLLAVYILAAEGEKYGLSLPKTTSSTRFADFDFIETTGKISLDRLSSELKMDFSILRELNPALVQGCTPPNQKYRLRLPSGMEKSARIALTEILCPGENF